MCEDQETQILANMSVCGVVQRQTAHHSSTRLMQHRLTVIPVSCTHLCVRSFLAVEKGAAFWTFGLLLFCTTSSCTIIATDSTISDSRFRVIWCSLSFGFCVRR